MKCCLYFTHSWLVSSFFSSLQPDFVFILPTTFYHSLTYISPYHMAHCLFLPAALFSHFSSSCSSSSPLYEVVCFHFSSFLIHERKNASFFTVTRITVLSNINLPYEEERKRDDEGAAKWEAWVRRKIWRAKPMGDLQHTLKFNWLQLPSRILFLSSSLVSCVFDSSNSTPERLTLTSLPFFLSLFPRLSSWVGIIHDSQQPGDCHPTLEFRSPVNTKNTIEHILTFISSEKRHAHTGWERRKKMVRTFYLLHHLLQSGSTWWHRV